MTVLEARQAPGGRCIAAHSGCGPTGSGGASGSGSVHPGGEDGSADAPDAAPGSSQGRWQVEALAPLPLALRAKSERTWLCLCVCLCVRARANTCEHAGSVKQTVRTACISCAHGSPQVQSEVLFGPTAACSTGNEVHAITLICDHARQQSIPIPRMCKLLPALFTPAQAHTSTCTLLLCCTHAHKHTQTHTHMLTYKEMGSVGGGSAAKCPMHSSERAYQPALEPLLTWLQAWRHSGVHASMPTHVRALPRAHAHGCEVCACATVRSCPQCIYLYHIP